MDVLHVLNLLLRGYLVHTIFIHSVSLFTHSLTDYFVILCFILLSIVQGPAQPSSCSPLPPFSIFNWPICEASQTTVVHHQLHCFRMSHQNKLAKGNCLLVSMCHNSLATFFLASLLYLRGKPSFSEQFQIKPNPTNSKATIVASTMSNSKLSFPDLELPWWWQRSSDNRCSF